MKRCVDFFLKSRRLTGTLSYQTNAVKILKVPKREMSTLENDNVGKGKESDGSHDIQLEQPDYCCWTGCTNCVWIEYAVKMEAVYKNSRTSQQIRKDIVDQIADPIAKGFVEMQLRSSKVDNV